MSTNRIAKVLAAAAGLSMVLGAALPAAALTTADLQNQINALMAQLASLQGGSTVSATVFTRDLTIGSSGSDVTALQQWLISKGMSISAGATGYFGAQTQSALARYQASAGISPAAGYFGPVTRANVNSMSSVSTGTGTGTGTGTVSTGGTTGTITTPGVEGILSVTQGPISNTVVNVGQTMVPVLTVRAQAQQSDIAVQRVTVDLGMNTNIYNKIFSKLYVVDNATGNVLGSTNLNSSTVVQSGNDYIVTLTGFSAVVPAGTYKDLAIKADLYSSIDSTYSNGISYSFTIPTNGVRGVDGAGVDQYGPSTGAISQAITVNRSLVDTSQANISIAASTPLQNQVPVTDTTSGQYLKLPVMSFNVTAQNDSLHLHQVVVNFTGVPTNVTTATATAAYLFNGSTPVSSATINSSTGVATFTNITDGTAGATISAGQTTTFSVLADVTGVTQGSLALTATLNATAGQTVIYNSQDSTVTNTGSAVGNIQTVLGKGPSFTLLTKTVSKDPGPSIAGATSTLNATFNIQVTAVGADVLLGTQASATPAFTFGVYKGGTLTTINTASSSSMTLPSSGVVIGTQSSFTIPQNTTVIIPVSFRLEGRTAAGVLVSGDFYAVGVQSAQWVVNGVACVDQLHGKSDCMENRRSLDAVIGELL